MPEGTLTARGWTSTKTYPIRTGANGSHAKTVGSKQDLVVPGSSVHHGTWRLSEGIPSEGSSLGSLSRQSQLRLHYGGEGRPCNRPLSIPQIATGGQGGAETNRQRMASHDIGEGRRGVSEVRSQKFLVAVCG